ncbi:aspartate aminotransferase family protein [Micromonospora craterilacus]|uniref:Aspartate aminotransferase family protein n=2 Tax=Micromonospora craterilacus TaxID=1655439 RepID=A0A2W2FRC5_9ACTN|nr:aspartate aminotransferase family protein [Micromonospora craterilacus]
MPPNLFTLDDAERLDVDEVHDLYRRYVNRSQVKLMTSFGFGRELVAHAEGAHITLRDGRRLLDLTGGVGVLSHGHNHPRILAARERFARERRMEVHKTYFSPYLAALSHNLAAVLPGDLNMSFLPNSGAEAVEGAVKLAYKYHGGKRGTVLRADIAFHGKLLGSGGLTGAPRTFAFPTIPGIDTFRYNDLASVREAVRRHRNDVYAVLIEPFSASTIQACSEEFLRGLRELCDAEDIVLIFDEIYTGWGKTGSLFHFMRYPGLLPDVLTTSKSFGGGKSSISAFVAREPVFRRAYDNLTDALLQSTSTTYYGFGEETATALEAVNIALDDDYPTRAREIGRVLDAGLTRLAERHRDAVARVDGCGALWGVFLDGGPRVLDLVGKLAPVGLARDPRFRFKLITCAVVDALYRDHGIYTYYTLNGENPLVLAPPLVTDPTDVEYAVTCLDKTLEQGLTRLVARFVKEKVSSLW